MQIAGLPTGAASVSPQPSGPALAYGANTALPSLVQQVANHSTTAAPASFTLSGITSTKAGNFLVCLVSVAQSGAATISTPTNWTAVSGATGANAGNTLGGAAFIYPNNPGSITSVVFSSLTGVNGISVWFAEFSNVYVRDTAYASVAYNNSGTAPAATAYTPSIGPVLLVGMESDVTGQAYTAANVGDSWVTGTTTTSTGGATNTIIRPFYSVCTPFLTKSFQLKGTLAGSIANGAACLSLICSTTGPLTQPKPESVLVGAVGGGIGTTKPGGAGGGQ